MHLIAAHHGRARPHFPTAEVIDPERQYDLVMVTARGSTAIRPAATQVRPLGAAYLESLVRAADIMASQERLYATPAITTENLLSGTRE
jgi:CRISPR-associated endonuclease/helicase Cas3